MAKSSRPKIFGRDIKSIEVIGRKVKISWNANYLTTVGALGEADVENNEIILNQNYSDQEIDLTFLHEWFHWCLMLLGYQDTKSDLYVDQVAHVMVQLFNQLLETKKIVRKARKRKGKKKK